MPPQWWARVTRASALPHAHSASGAVQQQQLPPPPARGSETNGRSFLISVGAAGDTFGGNDRAFGADLPSQLEQTIEGFFF